MTRLVANTREKGYLNFYQDHAESPSCERKFASHPIFRILGNTWCLQARNTLTGPMIIEP